MLIYNIGINYETGVERMRQVLNQTGRPILFTSEWALEDVLAGITVSVQLGRICEIMACFFCTFVFTISRRLVSPKHNINLLCSRRISGEHIVTALSVRPARTSLHYNS